MARERWERPWKYAHTQVFKWYHPKQSYHIKSMLYNFAQSPLPLWREEDIFPRVQLVWEPLIQWRFFGPIARVNHQDEWKMCLKVVNSDESPNLLPGWDGSPLTWDLLLLPLTEVLLILTESSIKPQLFPSTFKSNLYIWFMFQEWKNH